ncbi:MAG: hypothetical protein EXR79_03040 [Myxococcales bacterium]|nr:hypothetical protein [Myxococcales bacterium]
MPQHQAPERYRGTFFALAGALTLLGIAPIWVTDILPVVDVGSHLHLIKILHEYGSSELLQRHYVKVDAIVPYLTYYKAVDVLAYFAPIEVANRIVLSVVVAAIPWSAYALIRRAGHDRWLLFGVLPWMLNPDFFMGFLNFLMSIPLFLWLLWAHLGLLRRPTWGRAALVAGLLCLMATTHYLLWAVALVLLPLLALVHGGRNGWLRGLGWPLREALLGLPSVGVLMPWFLTYFVLADGVATSDQVANAAQGSLWTRLGSVYSGEHLGPVENLRQLFDQLFDAIDAPAAPANLLQRKGELISTLWLAGLLLWFIGAARTPAESTDAAQPDPTAPQGRRDTPVISGTSYLGWVLLLCAAAYFVLPKHMVRPIWLWGVNFRLAEVLAILAVVALPLRPLAAAVGVRGRVWVGSCLLFVAACWLPIATIESFLLARTEFGDIRRALATIPPGHKVLVLRRKLLSRHMKYTIFNNITEYYAVLVGGYVPYSFADTSSKPFVVNRKYAVPAPPWDTPDAFSWEAHGRYYDYLVLFGESGAAREPYEDQLPATLHTVYQRAQWRVLRNPVPAQWPEWTPAQWAADADTRIARRVEPLLALRAAADAGFRNHLDATDAAVAAVLDALPWLERRWSIAARVGWPVSSAAPVQTDGVSGHGPGEQPEALKGAAEPALERPYVPADPGPDPAMVPPELGRPSSTP